MRLRPEQLTEHLLKGLLPVYVIAGEEPLQAMEAADALRAEARRRGYTEREVMTVEPGFDWGALQAASDALSLFAERRILELRMPGGKPGTQGAKVLQAYAERPAEDTILIVQSGKLDRGAASAKWLKALEGAGAFIQVWPLSPRETQTWIERRMRQRGLQPTPEAVKLLTERVEGNLLAAAQEIDKLSLLHGQGTLDQEAVASAAADSARYNVYDLADAALAGDAVRASRVLHGLRSEGVEPVLVLWALTREVRTLVGAARALDRGESAQKALRAVWEKRKPLVRAALERQGPMAWEGLLQGCAHIDRVIKGQAAGNTWDELLQLVLGMGAKPLFRSPKTGVLAGRA